jgi:cellulose synthase operon protein C
MTRFTAIDRLCRASPLLLAGFLLSCHPPPPPPAPEVEFSNCSAFYPLESGPVCALKEDWKLTLWVKVEPEATVEIAAGSQHLSAVGEEVKGGGRRFKLTLPKGFSPLTVSVRLPDGPLSRPWTLAVSEPENPAWFSGITRLVNNGKKEEARRELAELRAKAPLKEQGLVLRTLWMLAFGEADATAEEDYLKQGIKADRAVSNLKGEVEKTTLLARLYFNQGRFSEEHRVLDGLRLPPTAPAPTISKYQVAYYLGLLADAEGDYRWALEHLRQAANLADRVDMVQYRWNTEQVQARLLQDLGRSSETLFAGLRADPHPELPCDLGSLLDNWGWSRLVAREGEEEAGDPTPLLQEALALVESRGCPLQQRLNVRLNLALSQQQDGKWDEARAILEQAAPLAAKATLRDRLWWLDLDGREAIAAGRGEEALRLYGKLEALAERGLSHEGRFRAALGRARAHLSLRQRTEALAALAEADRRIDEQSRHVPVHEGRDTLVGLRGVATRLYLELLLDARKTKQAFALARRARSRLLRQLAVRDRLAGLTPEKRESWDRYLATYRSLRQEAERDAAQEWQLAEDQKQRDRDRRAAQRALALENLDRAMAELTEPDARADTGEGNFSPPAPGEVILTYHPLSKGQWVGFAAHGQEVTVSPRFSLPRGPLTDLKAMARLLLEPFRGPLEAATSVRVLAYGPLRAVDFHALPFSGDEPLLAHRLVVYSLDLPARDLPVPTGRLSVLLVSDPLGNLPAARQEGDAIAETFRVSGRGWSFQQLRGSEADAQTVRNALAGAALFHFAGHGSYAGFGGWESDLPLANSSRLTVGDVLALPRRVPRWVVLSACDAGRSSQEAPGEGIGLAHAFLLAGSQTVIAATRSVADPQARDLLRELYRGWEPRADLPRQLQKAQLACRQRNPAADWASLRVLTP